MNDVERFDLIVLGSGPAGATGAAEAASLGRKVAIVERGQGLGGSATSVGTLPSKALREAAFLIEAGRLRRVAAVDVSLRPGATLGDLLSNLPSVIEVERLRVRALLDQHGIEHLRGEASFVGPHTIQVVSSDGRSSNWACDHVLLATGSRPWRPDALRISDPRVLDTDSILSLQKLPATMAVIGGGVIGSEYACCFAALGVNVTLIDTRAMPLPFLDEEIAATMRSGMGRLGIQSWLPERVVRAVPEERGIRLEFAGRQDLTVEIVLVAAGRRGNTTALGLDRAGLQAEERELLAVDRYYRTRVSHIYAAGDVVGQPALASAAAEQARVAVRHAFAPKKRTARTPVLPIGIWTIPEVASIGLTEQELRGAGIGYLVGQARYADSARAWILGDTEGLLKLLFLSDDRRLVGVHAAGEGAIELVHVGLVALLAEAPPELMLSACFNNPTLGEMYARATRAAFPA